MAGEDRRKAIINELNEANSPLSATYFAKKFSVTRQIIVADIAILRASGNIISSEHKGYLIKKTQNDGIIKQIICKHNKEDVIKELYAIVDNGGKMLNVQVEHSIYGLITAPLIIESRYDADEFIRKVTKAHASQLSDLTSGIHLHTISVKDEECYERIKKDLLDLNILIGENN